MGIPPMTKVFVGEAATCAVEANGSAWCWAESDFLGPYAMPPVRWRDDITFVDIAILDGPACGATDDGRVFCEGPGAVCNQPGPDNGCFVDLSPALAELGY
jgi:hypothetical protein